MNKIKMVIGSDHAGFGYKEEIKKHFKDSIDFEDVGTFSEERCDYPDFAHKAAEKVNEKIKGVLICGSGNGMIMTANKHKNIRCALAWNVEIAKLARLHNDANMVAIPARFISENEAFEIIKAFNETEFEGERHINRVNKISIL